MFILAETFQTIRGSRDDVYTGWHIGAGMRWNWDLQIIYDL
jgi:hypothetical protein